MACSPLKVNRRLGRRYRLHLQGERKSQARNEREAGSKIIFNELQGVISRKTEPFLTTAVRISNPTCFSL
jgi:hypothetical protein